MVERDLFECLRGTCVFSWNFGRLRFKKEKVVLCNDLSYIQLSAASCSSIEIYLGKTSILFKYCFLVTKLNDMLL